MARATTTSSVRPWIVREADPSRVEALGKATGIPTEVARVLVNRGVDQAESAQRFLTPYLRDLHPPEGLADMDRAVERILGAIRGKTPILVYGDYDADGVTSVALLLSFLREVGARVEWMIPHRVRHGYGLHLPLLQRARSDGVGLVVTVDCGISEVEEIRYAAQMGMDVIVTDHHEVPDRLPPAWAVINPKRKENKYPFSELAGVGVAFLLVWALARRLKEAGWWERGREPSLKGYLDLVALGTVADQAPLLGENRILVKHGMQVLAQGHRPGLRALLKASGSEDRPISVGTVLFQIAPRLNAPGRLEEAASALRLLMASDAGEAEELAGLLDGINRGRQQVEEAILREAYAQAERETHAGRSAIVLAKEGWHPGVIGIVASRLVESFNLPVVLVAIQDGVGKGSARSPEGFHLMDGLRACASLLERCGGHRLAAGLTIDPVKIPSFREAFCEEAERALSGKAQGPALYLDGLLPAERVTPEFVSHLVRLEPHGVGNPEPLFQMEGMEIAQCRRVGQDHLKLWVRGGGVGFDAIGFNMGSTFPQDLRGPASLACTPQFNEWQGRSSIQLVLKDVRPL
ncbi:MAG: single-stranded-DNA-specific exonuclease RecJ [Thermodesulfobacteriota bacterium]